MSGRRRALGLWLVLLLALAAAAAPATAGPFEDGFRAFSRGDYAEALKLWRPLAEQGNAYAQYNLGFMYEHGRGVAQDYAEAVRWYRLAAEQGEAHAQNNLGLIYEYGRGVPQDYVQAHKWYNLAASRYPGPDGLAVKNRDGVAAKMTPAQIAEAQRLAREWRPGR